uniref:NADH-ubiquinone oxidoreductase chain 5 n=1 Tax=Thitarodes pui TaxID=507567 RepID=W5VJH0_THIPU|nr:NADH dehydrogenase subunit 5 [Thitarodes pui]AHH81828.1 NADH dehydrogenase subunit 5 [Thitarodes pui]QEI59704.1 NADH dehydrogenase subunit 5 [Thitarodes pui]
MNISICLISFFFLFLMSLFILFIGLFFIMNNMVIMVEWEIISLNSNMMVMTILLDWISLFFMSFVLLISSVVIMYSKSYMSSEMNLNRFIILVLMFVLCMLLLIISPNMISILLGWDGLGLISYCLVIYYQNIKSYNAGMLTALSNRIGDVFILMVIAWMMNYGSWNYIFYLEFMKIDIYMSYVMVLIVIAAMTKSAQIPFSSWLPAAMAAPTPVSALVHSSTLVTAGVYLLIRFNNLLVDSMIFKILLMISGMTMFMAGMAANFEFDLKKIIALSTLSQLGLMMSILSMGYFDLAFFHLMTHATFKALLFMCAGVVIHLMNDMQDIRFMGGMNNFIPLTSLCLNISNLALCGIPFLAGFYSKDLILEMSCLFNLNILVFILYYVSTGLTVSYTMRLFFYLMINDLNLISMYSLFDEDFIMLKSMFVLLFMSIISGSFLNWMIFYKPYMIYLSFNMKLMIIYVSLMGSLLGFVISKMKIYSLNKSIMFYKSFLFFSMMWFMPGLSTFGVNYYPLKISQKMVKNIDFGWTELLSAQGMYLNLVNYSKLNIYFQMNNIKIYLFMFILWMMTYFLMFIMFMY